MLKKHTIQNNAYVYKFILVGVIAFVFNYGLLTIFEQYLHIHKTISEVLSMIISLQLTFLLHDRWTYTHAKLGKHYQWKVQKRYTGYMISNTFGSIMTVVLFAFFAQYLSNLFALGFAAIIVMVWNFTMNKVLIWKARKPVVMSENIEV